MARTATRGNRVFDAEPDKRTQQLENKVKELTGLVGQLTVELKKTEDSFAWLES